MLVAIDLASLVMFDSSVASTPFEPLTLVRYEARVVAKPLVELVNKFSTALRLLVSALVNVEVSDSDKVLSFPLDTTPKSFRFSTP